MVTPGRHGGDQRAELDAAHDRLLVARVDGIDVPEDRDQILRQRCGIEWEVEHAQLGPIRAHADEHELLFARETLDD